MPSEAPINEWWVVATAGVFAVKGLTFAMLSRMVVDQYRAGSVPTTALARTLIRLFAALAFSSACLSAVFVVSWVSLVWGHAPDFWMRMVWRAGLTLGGVLSLLAGIAVVRAMKTDARNIRHDIGESADRTATAMERLADQGDVLAAAGVAARSASATERLADAGDAMAGNGREESR